jgi:hypothetical protein
MENLAGQVVRRSIKSKPKPTFMKTFLTIIITAALTWLVFDFQQAVITAKEKFWFISAVKAPGGMAIADMQADLNAGRYDLAKQKLQAFKNSWDDYNKQTGIGDVLVVFAKIETNRPALLETNFPATIPESHR